MEKESDDTVRVYYPITTNTMCLQYQGKPNEAIEASTLTRMSYIQ